MEFVLDASITACWALRDEDHPRAVFALDKLRYASCLVPAIWWFEIRNFLVINERRFRITREETATFLSDVSKLRIMQDTSPNETEILRLARTHQLTFYDSSYLELARRMKVQLATLDSSLVRAARSESVGILEQEPQQE